MEENKKCPTPEEFFHFELNCRKFKACKSGLATSFYEGDKFLLNLEQTDLLDPYTDLKEVGKGFRNQLVSQEKEELRKAQRLEVLREGNFF